MWDILSFICKRNNFNVCFFVFRSTNKSIIALIVSAIVILLIPITPYEAKLVAIVLAAVSSVFFIVLFRKVC